MLGRLAAQGEARWLIAYGLTHIISIVLALVAQDDGGDLQAYERPAHSESNLSMQGGARSLLEKAKPTPMILDRLRALLPAVRA